MNLIPITVLTGFLGSGKTTLLNHLLGQPELADAAVLINEFGEVGLDHLLVRKLDEDVVLLQSGCLCCTVRGDMVDALRDLFVRRVKGDVPEFNRVVIETTGLADPAPIIHTLMSEPLLASRYRLDGIVTTIDAVNGERTLDAHAEAVKQAAIADRLVLTKTDLADYAAVESLHARLHQLNPGAPILRAAAGVLAPASILECGLFNTAGKIADVRSWLDAEAYAEAHTPHEHDHHDHHGHHGHGHHGGHGHGHHHDVNRHDSHISAFVFTTDRPVVWGALSFAMELMIATRGENLLRVKGIVNAVGHDAPIAIHGVQHIFHPPAQLDSWPDDDHRTRIVFITRDLDRTAIAQMLDGVIDMAEQSGLTTAGDGQA